MQLSIYHLLGIGIVVVLMCIVGIFSGKNTKNAKDFNTGNTGLTTAVIVGTITGTLVGGASTIATTQLAFEYGYSALWFNLGSGLGCLCLGLFFTDRLRKNNTLTIQEMFESRYGKKVGTISAVFSSLGIFLSIVAQLFSAITILVTVFPINITTAGIIACLVMGSYVVFGGIKGTGIIGVIKLGLLYIALIFMVYTALTSIGDMNEFISYFPGEKYFNFFARGMWKDLSGGLSLMLGVICTQTYVQVIIAGRNKKAAVQGTLISACLIPPISIAGIVVGMFMKYHFPNMDSALAFPMFVINYIPDLAGGLILGTLFVVITGSGAGLILGICSIMSNNIYPKIFPNLKESKKLFMIRGTIAVVLLLTFSTTLGNGRDFILEWSFMAMGLRAMTVLFPMCSILFLKKKIKNIFVLVSITLSPILVAAGNIIFDLKIDALYTGLAISFVIMGAGYIFSSKEY